MISLLTKTLLALACLVALSTAADESVPAAGDRIFYLYSPESAEQRQRVARLWRQFGAGHCVAIVRNEQGPEGLTSISTSAAARSPVVPEYIKTRLDSDRDYFALTDQGGALRLTGRGIDLDVLFPAAITATEVDETTWGKVKDLFR